MREHTSAATIMIALWKSHYNIWSLRSVPYFTASC
ncbi:predicted protein [Botrytis cinerea T4]|uniref:Uncharacterized protein n=1 Tax=Botryotinia fuckeliana (strain T4) TaxID=999810 RepID=G2YXE4_BOTF4|nr:predicted protein [Botrytis cinerea T4]